MNRVHSIHASHFLENSPRHVCWKPFLNRACRVGLQFAYQLVILAVVLGALTAHAQTPTAPATFHVTGVHDRSRTHDDNATLFRARVVEGTVGNLRYTLEEMAWMAPHYTVGQDYPVSKITDKEVTLLVADKKGKEQKDSLRITNTEEVAK